MIRIVSLAAALLLAAPSGVPAVQAQGQAGSPSHAGMNHGAPAQPGADNPAAAAYRKVHEPMVKNMAVELTGDADRDFALGMLPHHQGAVDMAKVELRHGKDPAMRKLAREIIAAQEKEIALLNQWVARHPARP